METYRPLIQGSFPVEKVFFQLTLQNNTCMANIYRLFKIDKTGITNVNCAALIVCIIVENIAVQHCYV